MDINEQNMLFNELSKWSEEGENPALRKMIYLQMAHNMSEKDFIQLRNLFIKIDKNQDGKITATELREYFNKNQNSLAMKHHSVNLATIQHFLDVIDQNQNNYIDYREFIAATLRFKLTESSRIHNKNSQKDLINLLV